MILKFWLAVTILSAALSAIFDDMRGAVTCLWFTGIALAGVYLSLGSETLAMIQMILSTMIGILFLYHAVLFGEYGGPARASRSRRVFWLIPAALTAGAFFLALFVLGGGAAERSASFNDLPQTGVNLLGLGEFLVRDHLFSIEMLGITLLLVVVGAAVVSRPERKEPSE